MEMVCHIAEKLNKDKFDEHKRMLPNERTCQAGRQVTGGRETGQVQQVLVDSEPQRGDLGHKIAIGTTGLEGSRKAGFRRLGHDGAADEGNQ
jgi:hypothetical protein